MCPSIFPPKFLSPRKTSHCGGEYRYRCCNYKQSRKPDCQQNKFNYQPSIIAARAAGFGWPRPISQSLGHVRTYPVVTLDRYRWKKSLQQLSTPQASTYPDPEHLRYVCKPVTELANWRNRYIRPACTVYKCLGPWTMSKTLYASHAYRARDRRIKKIVGSHNINCSVQCMH